MNKSIVFFILFPLFLIGCTNTVDKSDIDESTEEVSSETINKSNDSNQDWVTYTNPNYNFSARIPTDWTVEEINNGKNVNIAKTDATFEEAWKLSASDLSTLRIDFDSAEMLLLEDSDLIDEKNILINGVAFDYLTLDTNLDLKEGTSVEDIVLHAKPSVDNIEFPTFSHFASLGDAGTFDQFLASVSFTIPDVE